MPELNSVEEAWKEVADKWQKVAFHLTDALIEVMYAKTIEDAQSKARKAVGSISQASGIHRELI